jgi:hypothetical protein
MVYDQDISQLRDARMRLGYLWTRFGRATARVRLQVDMPSLIARQADTIPACGGPSGWPNGLDHEVIHGRALARDPERIAAGPPDPPTALSVRLTGRYADQTVGVRLVSVPSRLTALR